MPELLLEIGTEEIPAGYLGPALAQMESLFTEALKAECLECGTVRATGTPRRLVLWADGIPERQPDRREEASGPPARVAFDEDGKPTKAAEGFAKGHGVSVEQIEVRDTKKGKYCFVLKSIEGKTAAEILEGVLPDVIAKIGFPKSMVWIPRSKKKGGTFTFARPVRSLAALFGDDPLAIEVAGVKSGRTAAGHPFMAPGPIELVSAGFEAYKDALRERKVIVDLDERMSMIREQIETCLARHGSALDHEALLDEVTNLVEYPTTMEGSFDEEFLAIPDAVVETAMMEHQRYFPVRNGEGTLTATFLFVANRSADDAQLIREGNERVLRARLADARFFWDEDRKTKLEDRVEALKGVQFLGELGDQSTYFEKAQRLERLASDIAREVGADGDAAVAAARLCKCDLVTDMVREFPSLQGIMGGEYAREEGQPEAVWKAIRDHYRPWSPSDDLPETATGLVVSLADKLDNLASCFSAGKKPTGSQDPFALRRQALAVLRMLEERGLSLSLSDTVAAALGALDPKAGAAGEILAFFRDRLYQLCVDRGVRHDIVNAVLAAGFDDIPDFFRRLDGIVEESESSHWSEVVFLVQRSANVAKIGSGAPEVNPDLLREPEEKNLWQCLRDKQQEVLDLVERGEYPAASGTYCNSFSGPVNEFFDKVFVNVDDAGLKNNRLRLVTEVNTLYSRNIADLSRIVISGDGEKS